MEALDGSRTQANTTTELDTRAQVASDTLLAPVRKILDHSGRNMVAEPVVENPGKRSGGSSIHQQASNSSVLLDASSLASVQSRPSRRL